MRISDTDLEGRGDSSQRKLEGNTVGHEKLLWFWGVGRTYFLESIHSIRFYTQNWFECERMDEKNGCVLPSVSAKETVMKSTVDRQQEGVSA